MNDCDISTHFPTLTSNTKMCGFFKVWEYMNTIFDQYRRLKFKNRMFSLRNVLVNSVYYLWIPPSLRMISLITEFMDIKQSNVKNFMFSPVSFHIKLDQISGFSLSKTRISFHLQKNRHWQKFASLGMRSCESRELCINTPL